jgi:hypothetical protein
VRQVFLFRQVFRCLLFRRVLGGVPGVGDGIFATGVALSSGQFAEHRVGMPRFLNHRLMSPGHLFDDFLRLHTRVTQLFLRRIVL